MIILTRFMLLRVWIMYGFDNIGAVMNCWAISRISLVWMTWNCRFGILPPCFDLKSLSNNLQSPLLHEATLFLLFIGHAHLCNSSNILKIKFPVLISDASWFLQLCTLFPCWLCLVVVLILYVVLENGIPYTLSASLY